MDNVIVSIIANILIIIELLNISIYLKYANIG